MIAIFSTSLSPHSRSRILARTAERALLELGEAAEVYDLNEHRLPYCDAGNCYADPQVSYCRELILRSKAVLVATPIYNYDVSAAAKSLVELTGAAWESKIVGFLAAAGGNGSYMSILGLANSLMLDFRSVIVPRFVYATEAAFDGGEIIDPEVERRTIELSMQTAWMANALSGH